MSATALALVITAALLHSIWNIAAKKAGGDDRFALIAGLLLLGFWAPVGVWAAWGVLPLWRPQDWLVVLASAVVRLVYFQTLLRGYRLSDLTVVYPVARGTGPLLSSFGAVLLLGEGERGPCILGAACIVLGVAALALGQPFTNARNSAAMRTSEGRWIYIMCPASK